MNTQPLFSRAETSALETNKVLRQTYMLLSMTLLFSAGMAGLSMAMNMPPMTYLVSVGIAFLLLWLVLPRTANSAAGIGVVFAFTGLMGFGLGPILNMYLAIPNGGQVVMTALGGTGVIFLALSAYAMTTRRDFSFLGGFLFVGLIVVLIAAVANMIFSGLILFDTSRIINGGETNYIMATVALYLDIYNLFLHLLHLLGAFSGDD